ncbi:unnamed protein product [Hermetia illucens]|uniref:Beta-glucosidase n=1 Tax=Hermetia illucens TaxID=343691 RepID=A0A7R8UZ38_HERIL|nr:unnamed protein product [Hermetia illucens]
MRCQSVLCILCLVFVEIYGLVKSPENDFPTTFKFGVSTSAFQIEGGWNEDGRGPSIWDIGTATHPEIIADRTNANIAADSYHKVDRDIEMLRELGVNFYRFSISWTRILPNGDLSSLNRLGIQYYNGLIDKLVANSIEPMVTMYHLDLPYEIQKIGGFTNPLFPQYFESYANVLYSNFGDRVKWWMTFNEPTEYCLNGYGTGEEPPFVNATGISEYLCVDNTIKAHARAYHRYKKDFFKKQGGKIGIVANSGFFLSRTNDRNIIDRGLQYSLGWVMHPIYSKSGGYPGLMIRDIASNSKMEGREWSRLPNLDESTKAYIKGTADFFGLNYYTSQYVELGAYAGTKNPSWENDARLNCSVDPSWKKSSWVYSVPDGLGGLLRWIKKEYNNVEVIIAENGWPDDGRLNDDERIEYLTEHLRQVSQAIKVHDCNVVGYAHWSLMDNFEWNSGYSWIKKEYDNIEVVIAENGWSDDGRLNDDDRVEFLTEHLRELSKAIKVHGCNVVRYSHWSLMDNFEWLSGYSEKFGLYYVNMSSPERTRIPKKSASVYRRIIETRKVAEKLLTC